MIKHAIFAGIGMAISWGLLAAVVAEEAAVGGAGGEQEKLTSHSLLPIFFYTPETRFGAGVAAAYFCKEAPEHRPNSLSAIGIVTTESQVSLGLTSEIYSPHGSHHLRGEAGAEKYPYFFWGVGNSTPDSLEETYTPRSAEFSMLVERRVFSNLTLGGQYRFWYEKVSEVADGGLLESGEVEGSAGGHSSGLGVISTWDTRDNIYYTRRGIYAQIEATYFGPALGSTYEYEIMEIDLRYFTPVFRGNSLAIRSLLRSTSGHTPFQDMPGIGGSFFLRGYPGRRYIDKAAFTTDIEFRTSYFWRFSLVTFGSLGHVAGRAGGLPDQKMRLTGGAGLRFRLNDENFNVRMDVGFGEETNGFYFIAGEAF